MRPKRRKGSGGSDGWIQKANILTGSRQLEDFEYAIDVISPPYEPKKLIEIVEETDTLKQLIGAMATNIALFNFAIRYDSDFDYNDADDSIKAEADKEWSILERICKYINPSEGFKELVEKAVIDRESIGWGTLEVLRDGKGEVAQLEYCRACNIRLIKSDRTLVSIKQIQRTENGEYEEIEVLKRFKKFVQMINGKKVYFKEFGDPRTMNLENGNYEECSPEKMATEIIYLPIHASYTDYGVPRWIGTSINAVGSRLSEVLNYNYFQDGRMIPGAITVDGGRLTEESIQQIREGKGIDNAYKLLVLETAAFEDEDEEEVINADSKSSVPKITTNIQPLSGLMNEDSLFQNYQSQNKEKIRDTFRLPPIYTGASADYNKATSEVAKLIAEEQIFIPEREKVMSPFNTVLRNEMGIKYVEVYLKGPKLGDHSELAQSLEPYIKAGTATPNMLIDSLSELLGKSIEALPDEIGNKPLELIKLEMQLNNQVNNKTDKEDEKITKSQEETIAALSEMVEIIKNYLGGSHEE